MLLRTLLAAGTAAALLSACGSDTAQAPAAAQIDQVTANLTMADLEAAAEPVTAGLRTVERFYRQAARNDLSAACTALPGAHRDTLLTVLLRGARSCTTRLPPGARALARAARVTPNAAERPGHATVTVTFPETAAVTVTLSGAQQRWIITDAHATS